MLTFAFMHYPYLVCILFGMPSLHLFTFVMFFKSCGKINRGQVICPLYRGSPLFGGSVIRGFYCIQVDIASPTSHIYYGWLIIVGISGMSLSK